MGKLLAAVALLSCFCLTPAARAGEARNVAADPVLEQRVLAITEQLRCLVCQNQTIADSHADLAVDLRNQVRDKLAAGQSEAAIIDFMVQRYGDFVLYKPPVKASTWLLWFGPALLLGGGLAALALMLRRRAQAQPVAALSDEERARAAALLERGLAVKENA